MFFNAGICLDKTVKIPRQKLPDTFDKVLADLRESTSLQDDQAGTSAVRAKVVVMFVNEDNCRQLVNATIVNQMTDAFYWLASDSWGAKKVPVDKQEWAAEGTVTILPQKQVVQSKSLAVHYFLLKKTCFYLFFFEIACQKIVRKMMRHHSFEMRYQNVAE